MEGENGKTGVTLKKKLVMKFSLLLFHVREKRWKRNEKVERCRRGSIKGVRSGKCASYSVRKSTEETERKDRYCKTRKSEPTGEKS